MIVFRSEVLAGTLLESPYPLSQSEAEAKLLFLVFTPPDVGIEDVGREKGQGRRHQIIPCTHPSRQARTPL